MKKLAIVSLVPRLPNKIAFWALATVLGALLFASAVPSPLYVVYQDEWGFSSITLTSVFAVYAVALLAALLVVGSISDHIGRRPTLLAALVVEIVAMVAFAGAEGVGWLFAARTLQGIATGTAMGAISAALLDLQPRSKPWLGALMGAVAPLTGLALGALAAGLLVDYGPDPTRFVFWLLIAAFAVALLAVLAIPETVERDGRWRGSLRPQVAVPPSMRAPFVAAVPSLAATWALGGLILSLGASLTAGVLGESSHLAGGLPIFVMAGISAARLDLAARRRAAGDRPRRACVALIAGVARRAGGAGRRVERAVPDRRAGSPGSASARRSRASSGRSAMRRPADQRAALLSAVYVVSYLAFSVPAIIAGAAVTELGLRDTAEIYGAALIAIAGARAGALRQPRAEPETA